MHYRNGREAHNGDIVVQLDFEEGKVVTFGALYGATPGSDYCNGNIAPVQPIPAGACTCDCLHIEDLAEIIKVAGLNKRPVGK